MLMMAPREAHSVLLWCWFVSFLSISAAEASSSNATTGAQNSLRGLNNPPLWTLQGKASTLLVERAHSFDDHRVSADTMAEDSNNHQHHRFLVDNHNFFTPLTCNTPICNVKTSTWTAEGYNPATGTVVIPCGHCITMNYNSIASNNFTLVLPFGLDIQGSLTIPGDAYKLKRLTIITPFVRVQGKLTMTATNNMVGALPNVKIVLTDNPSAVTSFVPAANNKYACSATTSGTATPCSVGNKPVVVAGGQLNIQGLPPNCATWVLLHDVVQLSTRSDIIVQTNGVNGCWGKGADILITSYSTDFQSAQQRYLVADPQPYGNGFVRLQLDGVVIPPITEKDGDGFAVEVALLSRNFVFEGARDTSDALLGGHLMVLSTPTVPQVIEGVELRNFGRQGEIGRYPIHFHLCGDVDGSIVSKNSIRYSNQRCVVVHGTHNLTVIENVSHETKGHCYMLEDGGELDNKFIRNLGASTRATQRVVRPLETDISGPSTFWISNPANSWTGNVAAGSAGNGFWFELRLEVRPPTSLMTLSAGMVPRFLPLKLFVDNVAHSNTVVGLRTYPFGFTPPTQAIFDNTRSYKNRGTGIFFHNSQGLKILGGVLADNSKQADFDRAENIEISGTNIIGSTARYNKIVSAHPLQFGHVDFIVGIQLHDFTTDMARAGATIVNVRFSGFADAVSKYIALIDIDNAGGAGFTGHFNYWSTLQGVSVTGGVPANAFDFRNATAIGVKDIYLIDVDSGMKPTGSSAVGTSSVISSTSQMKAFIDAAADCHDFSKLGYLYCRQTCFRTLTYATNPSDENLVLRVSDKNNPSRTFDFPGMFNYETVGVSGQTPEQRNSWIRKYRYYTPTLPAGSYSAVFIDSRSGQLSWPTFVQKTPETALCSPALNPDAVQLTVPSPTQQACSQLVRNGNMELSQSLYPYWLQSDTGIELVKGAGIGGTNAIADTFFSSSTAYIGQYLDTRCLVVGRKFNVQAWVKLIDPITKQVYPCNKGEGSCPSIRLLVRTQVDAIGRTFTEYGIPVAKSFVQPFDPAGWNLLQGTVTVDSSIAGAVSVVLFIPRGLPNIKMYLDNVSMTLM